MDPGWLLPVCGEQKGGACRAERPRGGRACVPATGPAVEPRSSGGAVVSPRGHLEGTDCDRRLQKGTQAARRLTKHSPWGQ